MTKFTIIQTEQNWYIFLLFWGNERRKKPNISHLSMTKNLNLHIGSAHTSYRCPYCANIESLSRVRLKNHIKTFHSSKWLKSSLMFKNLSSPWDKYWHWLLLKTPSEGISVITNHVNISWRGRVIWPTKGTGGLQHHIFFNLWWKTAS